MLSSSLSSSSLRASCQTAGTLHVQFVFLRLCLLVGSQKPPQAPRHAQVLLGHPRLSCHAIGCQICLVWSGLLVFLLLATLRGSFFSVCRRYRLHWATFRLCKGAYRRKRVTALPRERLRLPAPVTDSLHAPSKVQRADTPPFRIGLGTPSRWLLLVLWFGLVTPVQAGAHRKLSGTTPEVFTVCGHSAVRLTKSVKRAFKRAQARALVSGSTMYRGQSHSLASLAVRYQGSDRPLPVLPHIPAMPMEALSAFSLGTAEACTAAGGRSSCHGCVRRMPHSQIAPRLSSYRKPIGLIVRNLDQGLGCVSIVVHALRKEVS